MEISQEVSLIKTLITIGTTSKHYKQTVNIMLNKAQTKLLTILFVRKCSLGFLTTSQIEFCVGYYCVGFPREQAFPCKNYCFIKLEAFCALDDTSGLMMCKVIVE